MRKMWMMVAVTVAVFGASRVAASPVEELPEGVEAFVPGGYPSKVMAASALRHAYSLSPGFQVGRLTSCYQRGSNVNGREDLCRVVRGYEQVDDNVDWLVDGPPYSNDGVGDYKILAQRGSNSDSARMTIVLGPGTQLEGCRWLSPSNNFRCDYRSGRHAVLKTSGDIDSFVLRKLWHWGLYTGSALGCAGGIAGLWSGGVITVPLLADCVDGPL